MAAQQGEIEICNQAIAKVGGKRINSFSDGTDEANLSEAFYASTRDQVLEAADWSFARVRHMISPLLEVPVSGYTHAYQKPKDVLKVRNVYTSSRGDVEIRDWDVEGETIVVNGPSLGSIWTRSTQRIINPPQFSPLFIAALAARLAAEFAIPIAQSRALRRDMWSEYEQKLPDATSSDGQQGRTRRVRATSLIRVRGGAGRGPWVYGPAVPDA